MSASVVVNGVAIAGWSEVHIYKALAKRLSDDIRLIFVMTNPSEELQNSTVGEAQVWSWDSYEQLLTISNVSFEKFKFLAVEMNMEQDFQDPKVFIKRKF